MYIRYYTPDTPLSLSDKGGYSCYYYYAILPHDTPLFLREKGSRQYILFTLVAVVLLLVYVCIPLTPLFLLARKAADAT